MFPSQASKVYWYPSTTYQVFDSSAYELAPDYVSCGCMQYMQDANGNTLARVDPNSAEGKALDLNAGAFSTTSTTGTGAVANDNAFTSGFTSTFTTANDATFGGTTDPFGMPSATSTPMAARPSDFLASPSPQ
jgi:hypothetical protein